MDIQLAFITAAIAVYIIATANGNIIQLVNSHQEWREFTFVIIPDKTAVGGYVIYVSLWWIAIFFTLGENQHE